MFAAFLLSIHGPWTIYYGLFAKNLSFAQTPLLLSTLIQTEALPLSQLTDRISETLSDTFAYHTWWVIADVSNHSFYPNKDHHYFDLVEKEEGGNALIAKASAVAWKNGAARIRAFEADSGQRFQNGIRVCVRVQVDYHPVYGLKLVVHDVDPSFTIGQLELQRLATISRLLSECAPHVQKMGDRFITKNNSLSLAPVLQRIAVVSSSSAAGYQDFMHTLLNNRFGYKFTVNNYFTAVQGEANAEAARRTLRSICASKIPFDAVVIIRGGGADTDFLLFDQFALCKEVAKLHIPVITGIGHLKNQTLVDLLAHTSTTAPTKAAEYIIAHNHAFDQALRDEQQRIVIRAQQVLQQASEAVLLQQAAVTRQAGALLAMERNNLQSERENLKWYTVKLLNTQKTSLAYHEALCRVMSPVNLLRKGFALVYHEGRIITGGEGLQAGDTITVRLGTSELGATVHTKKETDEDSIDI